VSRSVTMRMLGYARSRTSSGLPQNMERAFDPNDATVVIPVAITGTRDRVVLT
jgi:hypothetical protein